MAQRAKKTEVVSKEHHRGVVLYSPAMVENILLRLSEGETLRHICLDRNMPTWVCVHNWMRDYPEFGANVARARALGKEYNLDFVIDRADEVEQSADVPVAKLQIDQRWKLIEREDHREELEAKKPIDPKLVEATRTAEDGWRVLESGEEVNPLKDAIEAFKRRKGLTPSGT